MRTAIALTVVALLLVAAAPPAHGQAPSCATLALSHLPPADFEPGAMQDVVVDVANDAQFAEVTAVVRANVAAAGWTVTPAEQTVRLAPNSNASVTFAVAAPSVRGESAVLNVVASGRCTANGQSLPIGAPGNVDAVPEATDSVTLSVVAGGGFVLPSIEEIPAAYFLGGLGLVVVVLGAVLAARKRSAAGFDVRSPEPEKGVKPGRGASFPLEVTNRGRQPDTARFEVGEVPNGWTAFMALPELTLAPGEARTLWLMVRAPPAAATGSAAVVPVVVRSKADPRLESRVAVRAEVRPEADDASGGGVEATRVG